MADKKYIIDNKELIKEWDYKKNNISPETISPNSHKKVWWICSKGHSWEAEIKSRNYGNGCPYCSGQKVLVEINDLQTINPNLANEWNYNKNSLLLPNMFLPGSNKKVWWRCSKCGYEWEARIVDRTHGRKCPKCKNKIND